VKNGWDGLNDDGDTEAGNTLGKEGLRRERSRGNNMGSVGGLGYLYEEDDGVFIRIWKPRLVAVDHECARAA
jgi:hypothetical protein